MGTTLKALTTYSFLHKRIFGIHDWNHPLPAIYIWNIAVDETLIFVTYFSALTFPYTQLHSRITKQLWGPQSPPSSKPLMWAALPPTSSGCPGPHPIWPWRPPGMRHPQLLWAAILLTSNLDVILFLISNHSPLSYHYENTILGWKGKVSPSLNEWCRDLTTEQHSRDEDSSEAQSKCTMQASPFKQQLQTLNLRNCLANMWM